MIPTLPFNMIFCTERINILYRKDRSVKKNLWLPRPFLFMLVLSNESKLFIDA